MSNLEESFIYLSPFQYIFDKEKQQNDFRQIVARKSDPSFLCLYCLEDLSKSLTKTKNNAINKINLYEKNINNEIEIDFFTFRTKNYKNENENGNENKIDFIKEILELQDEQTNIDGELKKCYTKEQELNDHLLSIENQIQQTMSEINGLEWEAMKSEEEVENISNISENAKIETEFLLSTPVSHSMYSMSLKLFSPKPSSPIDSLEMSDSDSLETSDVLQSSSLNYNSFSYFTSSLLTFFVPTEEPVPKPIKKSTPFKHSNPYPIHEQIYKHEQKQKHEQNPCNILSINRIRISYCPIPAVNLNWGEICFGWTLAGSFIQGIIYEIEEIRKCLNMDIEISYTYSMIILREYIAIIGDDNNPIKNKKNIRRLFCSGNTLRENEKYLFEASSEYILSLICFGIIIIECIDVLNYLSQYFPIENYNKNKNIDFCQQPSLLFLKSLMTTPNILGRKWPHIVTISNHFSDKNKLIKLSDDILSVIHTLSLRE